MHCWRECKLVQPLWKAVWSYLKKIKNGIALRPSDSTSGNLSKEIQNTNLKKYMYSYVHCSVIYNSQDLEAAKCPSVDEWIKQLWYIYTVEYYPTMNRKNILPFVTVCMDLANIILTEISHSEKDKYYVISLICGI